MKNLLKFLGIILYVIITIFELIEFLAIPALFIIIGLLNSYSWKYYAITIGGYIAIYIIIELVAHFVFKSIDKRYSPRIERKLENTFNRFSNNNWL